MFEKCVLSEAYESSVCVCVCVCVVVRVICVLCTNTGALRINFFFLIKKGREELYQ